MPSMVLGLLGETAAKLVGEAPPPENAITLLPRMGEKPVLETELRNARKSNAVRIVRVQVYSKLFECALGYFFCKTHSCSHKLLQQPLTNVHLNVFVLQPLRSVPLLLCAPEPTTLIAWVGIDSSLLHTYHTYKLRNVCFFAYTSVRETLNAHASWVTCV